MKRYVFVTAWAATFSLWTWQTPAHADAGSAESSSSEVGVGPGGGGDGGLDDGTISTEGANPNIDADLEAGVDSSGHSSPGMDAGPEEKEAGGTTDGGTTEGSGGGCSVMPSSDEGALEGFALLVGVASLAVARRSKTRAKARLVR